MTHCKIFKFLHTDTLPLIVNYMKKSKPRKAVLIVKLLHFVSLTLQLDSEVDRQAEAKKGGSIVKLLYFCSLTLQLDSEIDRQSVIKKWGFSL